MTDFPNRERLFTGSGSVITENIFRICSDMAGNRNIKQSEWNSWWFPSNSFAAPRNRSATRSLLFAVIHRMTTSDKVHTPEELPLLLLIHIVQGWLGASFCFISLCSLHRRKRKPAISGFNLSKRATYGSWLSRFFIFSAINSFDFPPQSVGVTALRLDDDIRPDKLRAGILIMSLEEK